jgi:hypothetical protein
LRAGSRGTINIEVPYREATSFRTWSFTCGDSIEGGDIVFVLNQSRERGKAL